MLVLLFNFLPWIIVAITAALAYGFKKWWILVIGLVALLMYNAARPSYAPFGVVERKSLPPIEQREDLEIRDISLKAKTDYAERVEKMQKEGLPFVEKEKVDE